MEYTHIQSGVRITLPPMAIAAHARQRHAEDLAVVRRRPGPQDLQLREVVLRVQHRVPQRRRSLARRGAVILHSVILH
jgi:hypothetical protein